MLGDIGNIRGVKRTAFKSAIFKVTFIKPVSGRKPGAGFCQKGLGEILENFIFFLIEFALGLWYDEPEE